MWTPFTARTMWCVGIRRTAFETVCLKDRLDCTASICVHGGMLWVGET